MKRKLRCEQTADLVCQEMSHLPGIPIITAFPIYKNVEEFWGILRKQATKTNLGCATGIININLHNSK